MAELTNEQLAEVAHDFYLSKLSIAEITKKYGLSRYLIGKALDTAQARGIVHITINSSIRRNADLERQIRKHFKLQEVFVLQKLATKIEDERALVNFAAKQVQRYLEKVHTVGLTWGTTLLDLCNNLQESDRPDLNFIQLLGIPINSSPRKNPLVQRAADKFTAQAMTLPVPLYLLNTDLVKQLKQEPFFAQIDQAYQQLDMVISGIGTLQSWDDNPFLQKYYHQALLGHIDPEKIAGFIFGRAYDIYGNVYHELEPHLCGISEDEIRQVPMRIIIEKNRFKTKALLGALRTGYITHLVLNEGIAQRLLQEVK